MKRKPKQLKMCKKEFRYQLKLTKLNELKFLSHLDWQNLILKSLRRAGVCFALSEGFNKVPKISFAPALPLFISSECELVNFITTEPLGSAFLDDFKIAAPENLRIINIKELENDGRRMVSLDNLVQWAKYEAELPEDNIVNKMLGISNFEDLRYTVEKCLSSNDFFIEKKTKKGILKQINYRNSIKTIDIADERLVFILKTGQDDSVPALRADEFLKCLIGKFTDKEAIFEIKRLSFFDKNMTELL